jgi:GNAT superfamily N-acetyltransferase
VRDPERPDEAEIALVVGDALQGQGLGTALGRALAALARERGIARFTATMLADNEPARRLLASITGEHVTRLSGGVRQFVGELPAPAPAAPAAATVPRAPALPLAA